MDLKEGSAAFEGVARLVQAQKSFDIRALEILAFHLAIEREMLIVFGRLLPASENLRDLGFAQKVRVLRSVWTFGGVEELGAALDRFNTLRNRIAHDYTKAEIDAAVQNLQHAAAALAGDPPQEAAEWSIETTAALIMGYLNGPADRQLVKRSVTP